MFWGHDCKLKKLAIPSYNFINVIIEIATICKLI